MPNNHSITDHDLNIGADRMWLLIAAFTCVGALFICQGRTGFNLWDEGFLWYGAQRTLAGEVPSRDFMAYDPGRYYWSAAIMKLCGDNGIIVLRVAAAIFQAIGLFIGLNCLFSNNRKMEFTFLVLAVLTLSVWMYPRHKLFDISLSIALMGVISSLVQNPSARRYFLAGIAVGFVAVFGRNHGLYGVVGCFGAMTYLAFVQKEAPKLKGFVLWGAGIFIGFLPVVLMILLVPGFAQAFRDSILSLLNAKTTNLPLPVPWPWQVAFGTLPLLDASRGLLIGLFFVAIVIFALLGIVWLIMHRYNTKHVEPCLVAAVCLALPYAHFAYSRADVGHLALGIFPFLVGMLSLLAMRSAAIKWGGATLLCGASLLVMLPMHPGWQRYANQSFVEAVVGTDRVKVDQDTASNLRLLQTLVDKYAPNGQSFLTVPFWPGAYAAMGVKAPLWEIYPVYPRNKEFEHAEINRIKAANPGFAFIFDMPLDGREALRYRNTHPVIHQFIIDNFEIMKGYSGNPSYKIYVKKQAH